MPDRNVFPPPCPLRQVGTAPLQILVALGTSETQRSSAYSVGLHFPFETAVASALRLPLTHASRCQGGHESACLSGTSTLF